MRERMIVEILKANSFSKLEELEDRLNLSSSSIKRLIKQTEGNNHGYKIKFKKGKGYHLVIENNEMFNDFITDVKQTMVDVYNKDQRIQLLIFIVLQKKGYFTVDDLLEQVEISRRTIIEELKIVKRKLSEFNLSIESQPFEGLTIIGDEFDFRRAFMAYVVNSPLYLEPIQDYRYFLDKLDSSEIKNVLNKKITNVGFWISDIAFENLLLHLQTLVYRVLQNNFIQNTINEKGITEINPDYCEVAEELATWINEKYNVKLPDSEVLYLAQQISAKVKTKKNDSKREIVLNKKIQTIFEVIDAEFLTDFSKDKELLTAMLMHMFPLINRLYLNLNLQNPLIEDVYTKYTNVFVVACRFGELIKKEFGFDLSRDELGYIALHFAASFERKKQQALQNVRRVVVVCTTGGGSSYLLRLKVEDIFSDAMVVTTAYKDIGNYKIDLPDLFLSTVPIKEEYNGVPVIHIKHFLDESEIRKIKEIVFLNSTKKEKVPGKFDITKLFSKDYFLKNPSGDYFLVLNRLCKKMYESSVASKDFEKLVIEREKKFSTIYKNGVAGPHSMVLNAKTDSVGLAIFDRPKNFNGRNVQIIFLINLKQGHLFLHREISRILLRIIENTEIREQLCNSEDFETAIKVIGEII